MKTSTRMAELQLRHVLVTFIVCLTSALSLGAGEAPQALTPLQLKRLEQITTYFENDTIRFAYAYVENLNNGRGYTVGRIGFCTGTGDAYQVVKSYCENTPFAPICLYRNELKRLTDKLQRTGLAQPDVSRLPGFPEAWKLSSLDANFRLAQDKVVDSLYLQPALQRATTVGLKTPIARAIFYDTIVQQGETGGDSLAETIERTRQKIGPASVSEIKWLNVFLDVRREILLHPKEASTKAAWVESVSRVDQLKNILNTGNNVNLSHRIRIDDNDVKPVWTD